jgi:hypothetical protein
MRSPLGAHLRSTVEVLPGTQVTLLSMGSSSGYPAACASWSSQLHVLQRDVALAMQRMRESAWSARVVFFVLVLRNVVQTGVATESRRRLCMWLPTYLAVRTAQELSANRVQ